MCICVCSNTTTIHIQFYNGLQSTPVYGAHIWDISWGKVECLERKRFLFLLIHFFYYIFFILLFLYLCATQPPPRNQHIPSHMYIQWNTFQLNDFLYTTNTHTRKQQVERNAYTGSTLFCFRIIHKKYGKIQLKSVFLLHFCFSWETKFVADRLDVTCNRNEILYYFL